MINEVRACFDRGQPALVGTTSIEANEKLSAELKKAGLPHNVLNAKQHEREAHIIENAGQPGAITIATNMAGRGVDIKLGEGVIEAGGLYVLGTERHESRRIDNQLRGRAGRQGDPGESRFYLAQQLGGVFGLAGKGVDPRRKVRPRAHALPSAAPSWAQKNRSGMYCPMPGRNAALSVS